jgi:hypothetical protein
VIVDDQRIGFAGIGVGAVLLVVGMLTGSRFLRVLGIVKVAAGAFWIARARLTQRAEEIERADANIRAELDDLDPVARAQVLAGLAND